MTVVYRSRLLRDFPPDEIKPLNRIRAAMARGSYLCLGLFQGESLLAYAFFVIAKGAYLLDYFAVEETRRGTGVGSAFLRLLEPRMRQADMLLIEVEHPDYALDADERRLRERRRAFYLRAGCADTGVDAEAFGVAFRLLELPLAGTHPAEAVKKAYLRLYQKMLPPILFRREVHLLN